MSFVRSSPQFDHDQLAIVIPVKDFNDAKSRLRQRNDDELYSELGRALAANAYHQAATFTKTYLTSESQAVRSWAQEGGYPFLFSSQGGLNATLDEARSQLTKQGVSGILVVHGDIAVVNGLDTHLAALLTRRAPITSDRFGMGTNVLGLPSDTPISFAFGENSFEHHLKAIKQSGVEPQVIANAYLEFDLDDASDLKELLSYDWNIDSSLREILLRLGHLNDPTSIP